MCFLGVIVHRVRLGHLSGPGREPGLTGTPRLCAMCHSPSSLPQGPGKAEGKGGSERPLKPVAFDSQ